MIKLDGWITIGTKLDTDQFDKQMSDLEKKIDSEEKKQELLNNKTKEYEKDLGNANREVRELTKEYNNAVKRAEQLADILSQAEKITPRTPKVFEFESKYKEQVKIVDELSAKLDKAEKAQSNLNIKVQQTKLQQENSAKAVDKLRGKINSINLKRQKKEFDGLQKSIDSLSKGVSNTIAKIGKMALAVFGVRSAYMALRRASSTLAQYNEQYAKNLEYISFALAQTLAPILEWIVNITQTLLRYINLLFQRLFGINLFSNSSSKDFEKMSKNANGIAKSTKDIKNNLAGFDELNVLSKNDNTDSNVGAIAPSFDLSDMEGIEVPSWLNNLKEAILSNFDETSIAMIERVKSLFDEISKTAKTAFDTYKDSFIIFYTRGFLPLIDSIKNVWSGMWELLGKAWDKWGKPIFENIRTAIRKVGNIFQSLWDNFLQPIWERIAETIDWLWNNHLSKLWENILDLQGEFINGVLVVWNETLAPFIQWLIEVLGPTISRVINTLIDVVGSILGAVVDVASGVIRAIKGIVEFTVGIFTGDWEKAWQGIKDFFGGIWDGIVGIVKGAVNLIIDMINGMLAGLESALNWIVDKINALEITNPFTGEEIWSPNVPRFDFGRIPKLARGGIIAKPTQAVIGEAGREAVMPLDNNTEWMDILAEKLSQRETNGGQQLTIRFEGSMAQLVRELKPQFELENKRVGTRIITAGGAY